MIEGKDLGFMKIKKRKRAFQKYDVIGATKHILRKTLSSL